MASRRSKRGAGLAFAAQEAAKGQAGLEEEIEARARFENERDYLYRVGFEHFDDLDTQTRKDLVREAAVVGGIGGALDIASSPRRLGLSQATKAAVTRLAPDLARKLYARAPEKRVVDLMGRIEKARLPTKKWQKLARAERERAKREGTLPKKDPRDAHLTPRGTKPGVGGRRPDQAARDRGIIRDKVKNDFLLNRAADVILGSKSGVLNARDALQRTEGRVHDPLFRAGITGAEGLANMLLQGFNVTRPRTAEQEENIAAADANEARVQAENERLAKERAARK